MDQQKVQAMTKAVLKLRTKMSNNLQDGDDIELLKLYAQLGIPSSMCDYAIYLSRHNQLDEALIWLTKASNDGDGYINYLVFDICDHFDCQGCNLLARQALTKSAKMGFQLSKLLLDYVNHETK